LVLPGSLVKEHRDHDLRFEDGTVRIPLRTHSFTVASPD